MLHPMLWLASTRLPWKSIGRKSHPQKSLLMALVYPNQIAIYKTILVYGCGRVRWNVVVQHWGRTLSQALGLLPLDLGYEEAPRFQNR